jgi:hypothetical protein
MKRTLLGLAPLTLALAFFSVACGDDDPGTEAGETGDGDGDQTGDGDGDQTGDGDGDMTGDGDGDMTGDGDGDGGPDSDDDGVPDSSDNCPNDPNPNQLDFDGNGIGNVCDAHVFSTVSGTLNSTGHADAGFAGQCMIPIMFQVTSGEVRVQLDDDAEVAGFEIVKVEIEDVLDKNCQLLVSAVVSIKDFSINNNGGDFPVSVAHSQAAHNAGSIAGDADIPHPILALGILEASVNNGEPMPSELNLDGTLPIFTANISGGGASGTLAWADGQYVLAMETFTIDQPIKVDIDFTLRGLVGSLVIAP